MDSRPGDLAAAEINADADNDVVVTLSTRKQFLFLAGQGNGGFAPPVPKGATTPSTVSSTNNVALDPVEEIAPLACAGSASP